MAHKEVLLDKSKMFFRVYCNECKKFMLFNAKQFCIHCKLKYTTVLLSSLSPEVIAEHKQRLKDATIEKVNGHSCHVTREGKLLIIECELTEPEPKKEKAKSKLSDYLKLGRNEPCACGSGKKYKKCCLPSVTKQRKNYEI